MLVSSRKYQNVSYCQQQSCSWLLTPGLWVHCWCMVLESNKQVSYSVLVVSMCSVGRASPAPYPLPLTPYPFRLFNSYTVQGTNFEKWLLVIYRLLAGFFYRACYVISGIWSYLTTSSKMHTRQRKLDTLTMMMTKVINFLTIDLEFNV